jgi:hypothetical protein
MAHFFSRKRFNEENEQYRSLGFLWRRDLLSNRAVAILAHISYRVSR